MVNVLVLAARRLRAWLLPWLRRTRRVVEPGGALALAYAHMGALKYAAKHAAHNVRDCPPGGCREASGVAFRFVHNPMSANDFLPTAPEVPSRLTMCKAWGLSLYASAEQARAAYRANIANRPKLLASGKIGNHLAVATLQPDHGRMHGPAPDGHITLHESATVRLEAVFKLYEPI